MVTIYGFEMVGGEGGAMSDASKRLHDAVEDVVTDSVTQMAETNATPEAVPKMNRVRRALAAVNTEAMITTAALRDADDDGCASGVS